MTVVAAVGSLRRACCDAVDVAKLRQALLDAIEAGSDVEAAADALAAAQPPRSAGRSRLLEVRLEPATFPKP